MPEARWFEGASLNYAEHIFRNKTSARPAIVFRNEKGDAYNVSWLELETQVARLQAHFISQGITKGDRIVGYLPNIPEAIIAFLAANSLGAIWSCCSPDFGVNTVIDRFSQIEPKILMAADGYFYNGKRHDRISSIKQIQESLPSLQKTIIIPYLNSDIEANHLKNAIPWKEATSNTAINHPF